MSVLRVTSVVGNVRSSEALARKYKSSSERGELERVTLSRMEAQRSRMRRTTDAGTDVAIELEEGSHLRHGDVLLARERMIVVEYEPEDIVRFTLRPGLKGDERVVAAVRLGHMIGNLHRPISTMGGSVSMPLQSEGEMEIVSKALGPLGSRVDARREKAVFEPDEGVSHHAH